MTPHFFAHIFHILKSIDYIDSYLLEGKDSLKQQLIYDAVVRRLQTLSESAHKLPEDIKQTHPHLPWKRISIYRNALAHDYLEGSDPEEVWQTVQKVLPILKAAMLHHVPNWEELKSDC